MFGTNYPTQDGTCERDCVHVNDLAEAHVAALVFLETAQGVHKCNLGTGHPYSFFDIMRAVERVTCNAPQYDLDPRQIGDVAILTADIGRVRADLGFEPKLSDLNTIVWTAWNFHKTKWTL